MIRFWRWLSPLCGSVLLVSLCVSRAAWAAPHDDDATKLRKDAIEHDYLATDFDAAVLKLTQALALCAAAGDCSAATRARLHCDLGAVYFAQQKKDYADSQLAAALKDDPNVTIGADLTTAELKNELATVKAANSPPSPEAAGPAAPAKAPTAPGATEKKPASPKAASAASPVASTAPSEDCPPGLPGCKATVSCTSNDDCGEGSSCDSGICARDQATDDTPPKANWITLAAEQDFLVLPSASQVCAGASGYTCFESNGNYDAHVPVANAPGDSVNGGLAPATTRFMVGYDRAFGSNVTVGGRLGFALGGGPTRPSAASFMPVHAEVQGKYWIGRNALAHRGLRFYGLAAVGLAEVDSSLTTNVFNQDGSTAQASAYQAWKKAGQEFVGIGLGAMFAFTRNHGIVVEVRGMQLVPTSGQALGVQLGYTFGL